MKTVLRNGRLIDGRGGVIEDAVVIVEGSTIKEVGTASDIGVPEGENTVVDLVGMTILPGLIDLHVHLWGDVSEVPVGRLHDRFGELVNVLEEHDSYLALFMADNARKILEAGFTTIRDTGSPRDVAIQVARAERDRLFVGPQVLACATIDITYPEGKRQNHGVIGGNITGPVEAVRAVRLKVGSGADWIHLIATGSAAGFWSADHQLLTLEEMQAAAEEAHRLGRLVNANACGVTGIRDAILAGVDCIEHGSYIGVDEDVIQMMVDRQIGWVPTLCVYDVQKQAAERAAVRGGKTELPDYWISRVLAEYAQLVQGFEKALQAGVPIAVGTDSGAPHVEHGGNALEMEMLVRYGMSEMDAIAAATSVPARILGLSDRLGTVEVGKQADMVIVKNDPLKDIRVLQEQENIVLVIKHGELVVNRMPVVAGV